MCPLNRPHSGIPAPRRRHARRSVGTHLAAQALAFAVVLVASCPSYCAPASTSDARKILESADRIRFPADPFEVDVTITTSETGGASDVREYRILSKGNDRTLVQTLAPAIDRGQILLMRNRDLWVFIPNVSQPIRLPLSQRLTGQVANGDLARANFLGDYNPKILRRESIKGGDYDVLELTAVDRWVTYHRVLYWVNVKNHHPYKAEFYALSGRLLKTAHYKDFRKLGGEIRPAQLVIEDALRAERKSVLEYRNMTLHQIPDKFFDKDYLKKLSR